MVKTYIFPFFSRSLSSLCVIYPRGFSQSTAATKTTKTYVVLSFIHCGIIKILKFFFLTQNFFSLCCRARWCKTYKNFSLSQSFFSLCNLPQRKVSTQLQTGYNGSQRVTTDPNGLERVPTGSNGFDGGGGERKGQWHVYYLPINSILLFISFI